MATIRKRGTRWQAIVRKKGHKPQSKTFTKKSLAERWARETEYAIETNNFVDSSQAGNTFISELITRFEDEILPRRAKSSQTADVSRLKRLDEWFGANTLDAMSSDRVVEYVEERLEEVSSDSVRKELQILSDVVNAARVVWKIAIRSNPVNDAREELRQLRVLDSGVERSRRPTAAELSALLAFKHKKKTLINEAIAFAVETGVRRGELVDILPEHVDREQNILHVPRSKMDWKVGKKGRVVPLSKKALSILDSIDAADGPVFGVTDAHSITNAFRRMCTELKIVDLHFHDLRHEATSRFFELGLPIQEVAAITGHRDWRSLKRYTNPRAEDIAKKLQ